MLIWCARKNILPQSYLHMQKVFSEPFQAHAQCTCAIVLLFLGHIIIHERDEHLQIDISQGDGNIQKIFLRDKFFHNPKPLKRLRRKT